jgi:diphthamide biosynthesis enzyme Dph1/Dph2-like protein
MTYNLELDNVVKQINDKKAKLVCIQLPEGLKPDAPMIQNAIESKTHAQVIIWMGSCYGACDLPTEVEKLNVDLLIQWGHSSWSP